MGKICIVHTCGIEYYPGCELSFHRFPKNPHLRELWINNIPLSSTRKLNDMTVICSKHFKAEDFSPTLSRPTLKSDAVPSVFLQKCENYFNIFNDESDGDGTHNLASSPVSVLGEEYNSTHSAKRREFRELAIQVNCKTNRELILKKKNRILLQKSKRQGNKIETMKKMIDALLQAGAPPSLQNSSSFTRIINIKKRKLYQLLRTHGASAD